MINDQGELSWRLETNDIKIVHSESKCENIKGDEVSIRRPSSDRSAGIIVRAHFESGSDGSTEMYVAEMSLENSRQSIAITVNIMAVMVKVSYIGQRTSLRSLVPYLEVRYSNSNQLNHESWWVKSVERACFCFCLAPLRRRGEPLAIQVVR